MNTFKKILILFSLSTLFISCKPKQEIVEVTDTYEVVYKNQIGGKKEKSHQIIKNYEDFNVLISELNIDEEEYERLLKIDLEKHNLLVCFLGEKSTGGYDIEVEDVKFTKTAAEVIIKQIIPEKNAMVTMSFTSPYLFLSLPKNKTISVNNY